MYILITVFLLFLILSVCIRVNNVVINILRGCVVCVTIAKPVTYLMVDLFMILLTTPGFVTLCNGVLL